MISMNLEELLRSILDKLCDIDAKIGVHDLKYDEMQRSVRSLNQWVQKLYDAA
jgi:hypothetical protein